MDLSLLLVGRDGNGKSSTGNSILGGKPFTPTSNCSSVGVEIKQASATVSDINVTVTEIAGLEYPYADIEGDIEDTLGQIEKTIPENKNGFNAVIIVLKYGVRFTKQEKDALLMIRSIFGSNVVKDFSVVVMTNGDCFDSDVEHDKRTFEEWCQGQTGEVRDLFEDCENRCVLFNNRTKDEGKMREQRELLFSMITGIGRLYTLDEYEKAAKSQTEIVVQSKLPKVEQHKNNVMSEVWEELGKIDPKYPVASCDLLELSCLLNNMEEKLLDLKTFLLEEDKNTGVLKQLFYDISVAEMRIHTKRRIVEQKLQILASSATFVVCCLDQSEFDLQKLTETISLKECSIDKDGYICSKFVSGKDKDVSGYQVDLIEICKTSSNSQQVTETLGIRDKLSSSEKVNDVLDPDSPPNDRGQVAEVQGSPPTDRGQVAEVQGHGSQPNDRELVAEVQGHGSPHKDRELVAEVQGHGSPHKDRKLVAKVQGHGSPPKDRELVAEVQGHGSQPKDRELVDEVQGHGSQPKDRELVDEVQGHGSQPKDTELVAEVQGHGLQPKDRELVAEVPGHAGHNKPNDDLEATKIMFETICKHLKHDNLNHVICLISKYEQKLTKEEIGVVIEKVKTTYDTNEIKNHSILILTCDNDNLEAEKAQMFEDWYKEETGTNQQLLSACGNRCVLLNPWTKDEGSSRDGGLIRPVAGSGTEYACKNKEVALPKAQMATWSVSAPLTYLKNWVTGE